MIALQIPTSHLKIHYPSLKISPEDTLVQRLRNQEPSAFATLYRMYSANLFGVILKIVNQRETAEDLLQEVFLKIRRSIALYDPTKSKLFTWMLNIARYSAIDHLRLKASKNVQRHVLFEEATAELENHIHFPNTDTIGLKKLLENLQPKQRLILDLCYFKGYTHIEISEMLDMPLGSVKTSIRTAILSLRKTFNVA